MILLHENLPCSDNFFRYFKNYEKYTGEEKKMPERDDCLSPQSSKSNEDANYLLPKLKKSPARFIGSPKYNLGLSPIQKFVNKHNSPQMSPVGL
jgi:hypothetical protein